MKTLRLPAFDKLVQLCVAYCFSNDVLMMECLSVLCLLIFLSSVLSVISKREPNHGFHSKVRGSNFVRHLEWAVRMGVKAR